MLPLVLASASPRRSQLLSGLGLQFQLAPTDIPEPPPTTEDGQLPGRYVETLAKLKATACQSEGIIIAADTVVVLEDVILNKPQNVEDALDMLSRLQGRTHRVFTGVCLRRGDEYYLEHEITSVTFVPADETFLRSYIATGEPMDKAGAYAAQGRGALLVEKIEGDYWNVVGLPLVRLSRMLRRLGFAVESVW